MSNATAAALAPTPVLFSIPIATIFAREILEACVIIGQ
jgi:hypothetical protein